MKKNKGSPRASKCIYVELVFEAIELSIKVRWKELILHLISNSGAMLIPDIAAVREGVRYRDTTTFKKVFKNIKSQKFEVTVLWQPPISII